MGFGVVAGAATGIKFFEMQGPASGPITSHRAECTGVLAGAFALQQLIRFTNSSPITARLKIISDNKSLIEALTNRWSYPSSYTNYTLKADWDMVEEIVHTYRQVVTDVSQLEFQWVQGHQDQPNVDISSLPIEAQFNIQADELASTTVNTPVVTRHSYITPLWSQTRCVLDINQESIHGAYTAKLHRSIATPAYHSYLQSRHSWSLETIRDVDWKTFNMATRTYFSTEVHLVKLIHNLLPTKSRLHKYQPWISPQCQFCSEIETFHHLQTCPCHPDAITFRQKINKTVDEYLTKQQVPLTFRKYFMASLRACLSMSTPDDRTYILLPQQRIGEQLFTRGLLSSQWRHLLHQERLNDRNLKIIASHNPYLAQPTGSSISSKSSRIVLAGAIKIMWEAMGELWLNHLNTIHHTKTTNQSPDTLQHLRYHATGIQKLGQSVPPTEQSKYIYPDPTTIDHPRTTIQKLSQYISSYKPVIIDSITRAAEVAGQSATTTRAFIRQILQWRPTPSAPSPPTTPLQPSSPNNVEPSHRKRNRLRKGREPGSPDHSIATDMSVSTIEEDPDTPPMSLVNTPSTL